MRRGHGIALAAWSSLALAAGAEPERGPNPEHDGYPLYQRFCASCHGLRADGRGPRAPALKKPPPDLTQLSVVRGAPLRLDELTRVIDGRRRLHAHGEGPMPVWGEELVGDVSDATIREQTRVRLIQSLAEYVLSIQATPSARDADQAPTPP